MDTMSRDYSNNMNHSEMLKRLKKGKGFNDYRMGERVKKHIDMPYPEKYNKGYDSHLICIGYGGVFPNIMDACPDCHLILMK